MYPIDLDHLPVIQELLDGHRRNAPVAGGDHHLLVIRIAYVPDGVHTVDVRLHVGVD